VGIDAVTLGGPETVVPVPVGPYWTVPPPLYPALGSPVSHSRVSQVPPSVKVTVAPGAREIDVVLALEQVGV